MTPEQFVYWLQGFFELQDGDVTVNQRQAQIIKDHLELVFKKETPTYPPSLLPKFLTSGDVQWHTLLPETRIGGGWNSPPTQLYCEQAPSLKDIPSWEGSC